MKLLRLSLLLCLSAANLHAQRAVLKDPSTGAITESLASGAQTITISATGTLHWTSGATLAGSASALRTALGLAIGTDVQAQSATLTTLSSATAAGLALMDDADAAAQRTTLGLGAAAVLATSTGGNGAADSGKAAVFDGSGNLSASSQINVIDGDDSAAVGATSMLYVSASGTLAITPAGVSGSHSILWPAVKSGTVALTSDITGTNSGTNTGDQTITLTGDVTGSGTGSFAATLANTAVTPGSYTSADITVDAKGRITAAASGSSGLTIGTTAITGGTAGRILTSGTTVGELTPGTGVSTWMATPTIANLNSAISDASLATTGVNTFTGDQTIGSGGGLIGAGADYGNFNITVPASSHRTIQILADGAGSVILNGTTVQTFCSLRLRTTAGAGVPRNGRFRFASADNDDDGSSGALILSGAGTPEAAVTAPVGSLYLRQDGGANTTLYVKESGTGNTGWSAK